jgi:asparagine synthase (glutamine-hydrolysing)
MCGLGAALLTHPQALSDAALRERGAAMIAALRHRGPDGSGCWTGRGLLLAHTRLAVIDPSSAADQPMHDSSGAIHVIFNGAIYNFRDLRAELAEAGYRFRTTGDTEVVVNGYRHWGTGLFERLIGMFAIVLWDSRAERLVAARDRFGEKPLFYLHDDNGVLLGSEIKAILAWPGTLRRPNLDALHDFLSFSYIPGEDTAFTGIRRLPPAHFAIFERGKSPAFHRYWALPSPSDERLSGSTESLAGELIERLRSAVKLCLVSDVPLGAFLSGGVDSSAVVASMAGLHDGPVRTFSSGFGYPDYDERHFARMVAAQYGTDHREFIYDNTIVAALPQLVWHYGEPFADSSALVTYALSRETRRTVTVALTGDGADETLLGYGRYFRYGAMRRRDPPEGGRLLRDLYDVNPASAHPATDSYGYLVETFRERHKLVGYGVAMLPCLSRCSYDRFTPHVLGDLAPEEQAGRIDLATYLPGDLLVKVDTAAMAHGLETRAPFLNHELVEWVSRLPADRKVWENEGKALLKKGLAGIVPDECMYRTKVGFRVPVSKMLREELHSAARSFLLDERSVDRQLMRREFVEEMLAEHTSRVQEHGTRLWALISLEMWFRTWIDGDGSFPVAGASDAFAGSTTG